MRRLLARLRLVWRRRHVLAVAVGLCLILGAANLFARLRAAATRRAWAELGQPLSLRRRCVPPPLQLANEMTARFVTQLPPLDCGDGRLWVRFEPAAAFDAAVVREKGALTCVYAPLERVSDSETRVGAEKKLLPGWLPPPGMDFLRISCTAADGSKYQNLHAGVAPKPLPAKAPAREDQLNVYILVLDSLSRLHFQRMMPRLYQFLTGELEAVVLEAYNIVGDGTPQATTPILTGQTEEELPNVRRGDAGSQPVNVYPFLWKAMEEVGYATLWVEDMPHVSAYHFRLNGFQEPPTHHYARPFFIHSESSEGMAWAGSKSRACLGPETQPKAFLRYPFSHFQSYRDKAPAFAMALYGLLTHDDINTAQQAEQDFLDHVRELQATGLLNRTLLLLMSDHGARFRGFRATYQGQLEERLPFVSLTAPPWWRAQNAEAWANLKTNARRLTTPFDLHPTLLDLLRWHRRGGVEGPKSLPSRGRSLWVPVPETRGCAEAGVEPHWCACLQWHGMPTDSALALSLARDVVAALNNFTAAAEGLCAELRPGKVDALRREAPYTQLLAYQGVLDQHGFVPDLGGKVMETPNSRYQIHLRTEPGGGLFEATFLRPKPGGPIRLDVNTVSRLNAYGNQSHCIQARRFTRLTRFCYCVS